ncbi:uncharacterized protein E1O_26020 [Burkholderiales bacterium GJ-E10]|nr:uncharacterized protein E1O_26020 [Burkholderiales bacterium GJ-E10]
MNVLRYAARSTLRNRRRSILAIAVVAGGVAAILLSAGFVLASFAGLRQSIIDGETGDLQIRSSSPGHDLTGLQDARISAFLARDPDVRFAMERIHFEGLLATGRRTASFVGRGVDVEKETRLNAGFLPVVAGTGLGDGNGITVAADLAGALRIHPADLVTVLVTNRDGVLNAMDFPVRGTYRTGIPALDRRGVTIPLAAARSLLGLDGASRIVVVLRHGDRLAAVEQDLRRAFPGLTVQPWFAVDPFYGQVVSIYRVIFSVFGLILILVVLLSISNALLMSVMERIREIGVLRAIGFPMRSIQASFALEGAMVMGTGSVIGIAVAAILSVAVSVADIPMPPPPGRSLGYPLQIFFSPTAAMLVFVGFVALGGLIGCVPGRTVRRMSIIEQLGHA